MHEGQVEIRDLSIYQKKNHVLKKSNLNQGQEPIHQKYKANESMIRHDQKKRKENQQSMINK